MKKSKKHLIIIIPLVVIVFASLITTGLNMVSQPSDMAVLAGLLLIMLTIYGVYELYLLIKKTYFKK